jgi:polysaccharide chain length determinant protein (PEP-CTERM system associated)
MVPGKTYKPEDYVEILWRRRWVGLLPFIVIAVGTIIGTQFLPNRYRSEARVLVVPQQVPTNYVEPTVTNSLNDRLQSINQQILTRTRLERIISDLDLYPNERKTQILEDVIDLMRRNVNVVISRPASRRGDPGYFTVSFTSDSPRTAMQVTDRLASAFITENLQDRTVQADQTSQFLQTQLDDARRKLAEHERKLEEFRRTYAGQLPTQVSSNLQVMQSTQVQLQALVESMNRDRDRQLTLDKMVADVLTISQSTQATAATPRSAETAVLSAAEQLAQANSALQALMLRLKPEHPDVIRAQRIVKELEQKAEAEALNAPVGASGQPASRLSSQDQKRISDMQAERESLERQVAASRAKEAGLQAQLAAYRGRVEAAPTREAQQVELMRDYDTLQQTYKSLLVKSQESNIAAELERRQIGEQFRVIEPARLPERPISPDRLRLNSMGAMAGLGLGLVLIGFLEYRDTSVRTYDDVTLSLALPVLAIIPSMITQRERVRTRRLTLFALAAASLLVMVGAFGVVAWKFDVIDRWVR